MNTTLRKFGSGLALCAAATALPAAAEERGYSALLCNPVSTTDAGRVFYNLLGLETSAVASAWVMCGAAPVTFSDVNRIQATVYDRNPNSDLCCIMVVHGADGFGIASAMRCSTGSGNDVQVLSFVPPLNAAGSVSLMCNIPGAAPTGASRVSIYRVRTS